MISLNTSVFTIRLAMVFSLLSGFSLSAQTVSFEYIFRDSNKRFFVDMDEDGIKDYVAGIFSARDEGSYSIYFYKGGDNGLFYSKQIVSREEDVDNQFTEFEVQDLDGDGKPEVFLQVYNEVENKIYSIVYKMRKHPSMDKMIFYRHSFKTLR